MIALLRADTTVTADIGGQQVQVPDIKLPTDLVWRADTTDQGTLVFRFKRDGRRVLMLISGPYSIGQGTYFIVDAPRRVLAFIRLRVGSGNFAPLIRALRNRPGLRAWAKAQGFRLIRNSSGQPVGIYPPVVICGHTPIDTDGDDIDSLPVLSDLET